MTSEIPEVPGLADLSPLGRGGLADVYLARQSRLERWVAAKVFRVTLADEQAAERFRAECRAIGRLDQYPHVLTVYDAGVLADGRPYLISERCDGSLHDLVSVRGPLPADRVAALGSTIARALRFAHSTGVLHGDVTPQNVLLRTSGAPVLADFGLAVLRENAPTAAGFTVAHAAPEALRSGAVIDERADVYGLGSTLYTVLTGAPPFPPRPDEDDAAYRQRRRDEPAPTPEGVPDQLAGLLRAMLATEPDHRPSTDEVIAALQAAPPRGTRPGLLVATRPDSDLAIDPTGVPVPAPSPRRGSAPSAKAVALWSRSMRPRGPGRPAAAAHLRLDESSTRAPGVDERPARPTGGPATARAAASTATAPEPRAPHLRLDESSTRTPEVDERSARPTGTPTTAPATAPEPRAPHLRLDESSTRTPEVDERSARPTGVPATARAAASTATVSAAAPTDRGGRPITAGLPPVPRSAPIGESSGTHRRVRPAPGHQSAATPAPTVDPTSVGESGGSGDPNRPDGPVPDTDPATGTHPRGSGGSARIHRLVPVSTAGAPSARSTACGTVAPSDAHRTASATEDAPDRVPAADAWSCGRDDDPLGFTPVAEPVRIPGRPRRTGHRRVLVAATSATAVLLTGAGAGAAWRIVDHGGRDAPPRGPAAAGATATGAPGRALPVDLPASEDVGGAPVTGRALAEDAFPGITRPTAPSTRPTTPRTTTPPTPRRTPPPVAPEVPVAAAPPERAVTPEGAAQPSTGPGGARDRPVARHGAARSGDPTTTRER